RVLFRSNKIRIFGTMPGCEFFVSGNAFPNDHSNILKTFIMKATTIFLAALLPLFSFGNDEKQIKSKINEVTVFTLGAQVTRNVKMTLTKGENILAFEGLSAGLDEKSIQFMAEGDISILSLKYEIRYDEGTEVRKLEAQTLSEKLKSLQEDILVQNDILVISKREEEVLLAN